ncbi:MAG: BrnA antitoxin family protein [Acidobacteriota bacterium]
MSDPNGKNRSRTASEPVAAKPEAEPDYSAGPALDEGFFSEAIKWPGHKRQITLRLDQDVLDFYKEQGKGYQTIINSVLRKYMEAQKSRRNKSLKAGNAKGAI